MCWFTKFLDLDYPSISGTVEMNNKAFSVLEKKLPLNFVKNFTLSVFLHSHWVILSLSEFQRSVLHAES